MIFMGSYAQDKLFNEAVKRGRQPRHFYVLENTKNKLIAIDKLEELGIKKGYILGGYTKKSIARFGDVAESVKTLEFLPISEYPAYIFENLSGGYALGFNDLHNNGAGYLFRPNITANFYFQRVDGIKWSGEIRNSMLHGQGIGFAQLNDGNMVYFSGKFDEGVPQEKVTFKWFSSGLKPGLFSRGTQTDFDAKVGPFSEDLAWFAVDSIYGFVNRRGEVVVAPRFSEIVEGFKNDRATVVTNKKEIWIDKSGKMLDFTDHQKELTALAEKKRLEEERLAKLEAERKAREAELAEQRRREEAERAEKQRLEDLKQDYAMKRNSVGKRITWHETISYDTSGGGLGGLLLGAVGLGSTDYNIEYTAIVESVIGESNVKCIITKGRIISPSLASVNWFKYKDYAVEDMNKVIGQTRVKDFSEFELVK